MGGSDSSALVELAVAPVLIVDDDASIVRALRRLVEPVCPTIGASTIIEAYGHIDRTRGRFTALILDVHLEEGAGWEILVTARAHDPLLPAMMLTGMRWSTLKEQAAEFHAVPCDKPIDGERARRFVTDAILSQRESRTRMQTIIRALSEKTALSAEEAALVEACIAAPQEIPSSNARGSTPSATAEAVCSKTGARSMRDLRDTLLKLYFAPSIEAV